MGVGQLEWVCGDEEGEGGIKGVREREGYGGGGLIFGFAFSISDEKLVLENIPFFLPLLIVCYSFIPNI